MTVKRQHDADLCERIRKLEERVRELEAKPPVTIAPYVYPPYYVPSTPVYPYWTVWSGLPDNITISASDVTTALSGIQTTYTVT